MKSRIFAIVQKELKSYFYSPIAYITAGIFLAVMALWYFVLPMNNPFQIAELRDYFNFIPWAFILLIPAITMRSWAEEKRTGTAEILFTLPFKEHELVIGKFIAPLLLLLGILLLTLTAPISLSVMGDFEWGQLVGQYLGVFFYGMACISIGLFVSSLTRYQILAFLISAAVLFTFVIIGFLSLVIKFEPLAEVFNWISFRAHYESLSKGLIDTKDIVFFVLVSAVFLYLNIKVLVFKKWR